MERVHLTTSSSPNRRRPAPQEWDDLRAAYLAGSELRPLARAAGISEGTILCKAHREGWRDLRERTIATQRPRESCQNAIAAEAGNRAERHLERMRRFTDRVGAVVEDLDGDTGLLRIGHVARFDSLTSRTLGIRDESQTPAVLINVGALMSGPDV